jgi:hypothetical protein
LAKTGQLSSAVASDFPSGVSTFKYGFKPAIVAEVSRGFPQHYTKYGLYIITFGLLSHVFADIPKRDEVTGEWRKMFRAVFWVVLPCKMIVDRRFRGAYCLHHPEDSSEHHTRRRENLKSQNGGSCTMRNFIICTHPQILLGKSSQGECGGRGM